MKKIIVLISLLSVSSVFAECPKGITGSGRIWPSPIKKVVVHKEGCKIIPFRGQTDADPFCPLDDSSVMSKGIEVGLTKSGECSYKEGDDFSGNLVNVDDELWSEGHWLKVKKEKEKADVIGDEKTALGIKNSNYRHNEKGDLDKNEEKKKHSKANRK